MIEILKEREIKSVNNLSYHMHKIKFKLLILLVRKYFYAINLLILVITITSFSGPWYKDILLLGLKGWH